MYVIKKDLLNLLSYPVYFNCQKSILDILKIVCETFEVKFFTILLSLWDSKICVWETFCFYTFIFLYFLIFIFLYYFIFIFLYFTGGVYGGIVRQWNVSLGNLLFHCFTQPANLTRHSIAHFYFAIFHFIFLFWTFYILLYCNCICVSFLLYSLEKLFLNLKFWILIRCIFCRRTPEFPYNLTSLIITISVVIVVIFFMDIFIIITTTILGGGLWDPGVFEELTSQGGRRLGVTDGEGSLHNSSCTLLIEMRMGNYESYYESNYGKSWEILGNYELSSEELWNKFKRMTEEKTRKDIGGDLQKRLS